MSLNLNALGLTLDTTAEILEDLEQAERDALGQEVETGPATPIGAINTIVADDQRTLQEGVAAVYGAGYRASATGVNLDRIGALTGTPRLAASESRVSVDVTVSAAVSFAPGTILISVAGAPDRTFVNEDQFDQVGAGTFPGDFVAENPGPIEAPAGTLTVIPVPIANVTSVTNPLDADLGQDIETDTPYKIRQENELARPASATLDGMRIDILDALVDDNGDRLADDVTVFENTQDAVVGGMPPHSIEVLIDDGTPPAVANADAFQAVFDSRPGGILAFGAITGTATDSRGDLRPSAFTRPAPVPIELEFNLTVGPDWTVALIDTIKSAVAVYWQMTAGTGKDLIRSQLYEPIWAVVVKDKEVIDIVSSRTARIPDGLAFANVTIAPRERGTVDTGDIAVVGL